MSRPTPRLPDPALLGTRPLGSGRLGALLRGGRLVVALSGGADSVALLHSVVLLRQWLGAENHCGVVAAHFNHGIRGAEADADEAFVAGLCESLGVRFEAGRADVPAEALRTGESVEMAARRLRREFLRRVAEESGAVAIATGHTLDDQAELFFIRLKRGSSSRGLGGMAPVAPWEDCEERVAQGAPSAPLLVVRPLLGVRHETLCEWLLSRGLGWREDSTNADDSADRNKIRHGIVPAALEAFGPSFLSTLARTMETLRADDAALRRAAASPLVPDPLAPPAAPGAAAERAAAWRAAEPALARRRVAEALYALGADPEHVTLKALDSVCSLLAKTSGGSVDLGGWVSAKIHRSSLSLAISARNRGDGGV